MKSSKLVDLCSFINVTNAKSSNTSRLKAISAPIQIASSLYKRHADLFKEKEKYVTR